MEKIILKKKNYRFLKKGEFFVVKKGKVLVRNVLESGKVVPNGYYFSTGDIVGNFFGFVKDERLLVPKVEIELEALIETELEEIKFDESYLGENVIFEKLVSQFIKKSIVKFLEESYDSKGYILSIFMLCTNERMEVSKSEISYENFNMCKSKYYMKLSELKKENYIKENGNMWELNLKKINEYLKNIENILLRDGREAK